MKASIPTYPTPASLAQLKSRPPYRAVCPGMDYVNWKPGAARKQNAVDPLYQPRRWLQGSATVALAIAKSVW